MRLLKLAFGLFLIAHVAARPALCWDLCCGSDQASSISEVTSESHCHRPTAPAPTLSCDCSIKADAPQLLALKSDDLTRRFTSVILHLEAPLAPSFSIDDAAERASLRTLPTDSPPGLRRIFNLRI